jgi:chromosomal replication initiator protein
MDDLNRRVDTLKACAAREDVALPDLIARYIALTIRGDDRELVGFLIRVIAYASLTGQQLSLSLAQEIAERINEQWQAVN